MFDCVYCNTRHLLVVNERTIPQKIAGQNFPFDAHCPNSNILIYLKD